MSKSQSPDDYGALFQKLTGETEFVDEQKDAPDHSRAVDDELESYVEQTARDDGLDEAVEKPDTDGE